MTQQILLEWKKKLNEKKIYTVSETLLKRNGVGQMTFAPFGEVWCIGGVVGAKEIGDFGLP